MALIAITWNVYKGAIGPSLPTHRIHTIAQIAVQNNVSVVCLQEVPIANIGPLPYAAGTTTQGPPQPASAVMVALNAIPQFAAQTWRVWGVASELSPLTPRVTANPTGGYLFLYNTPVLVRGVGLPHGAFFNPAAFRSPAGAYYRPPFALPFTVVVGGAPLTVMTQHAESHAVDARPSITILSQQIGNPGVNTVICADLNVANVNAVANPALFPNWTDVVAGYTTIVANHQVQGLDHVLFSGAANVPAINNQLNFTSDAFHFPVAASFL